MLKYQQVGILKFISRINTMYEHIMREKPLSFSISVFYEQLKFHAQLR